MTKQKDDGLKVALNMILKEDEPVEMVKRAIDSVAPYVDSIYITLTYKEKEPTKSKLLDLLQSYNTKISLFKWVYDFATARNFAMAQVPKDFYYIFWIDADDILDGGECLPQIVKEAYLGNISAVFLNYLYKVELDDSGKVREVIIEHKRERLFRNDGTYKWIGMLHETLIPQKQENVNQISRDECVIIHLNTDEREDENLERNIKILEEATKRENHKDPRTLLYLAKCYFDKGKIKEKNERTIWFDLAKGLLWEYLEGAGKPGDPNYQTRSGWNQERAVAWSYISEMFRLEGKLNSALKAINNAITEDPNFPRYYLDLAITWTLKQEWDKAEHWLRVAMLTPVPKETTAIINPRDMKAQALEIDFNIAMAHQDLNRALKSAEKLVEILPNLVGVKERLEGIKVMKATNQAAQSMVYLARYLEAANEPQKIIPLLSAVPRNLEGEQIVSQLRNRYLPPRIWGDNEIAIFCGPGFEKWSPKSIKQGLGGSESAAVYLSWELAKLGWKVTVYADPQEDVGEYNKVMFKPWHEINISDAFNIFIIWRGIGFADNDFKAKQTYLWMHDVPNCADFTEERINKIDKIIPLSQYHRSLFKMSKNGEFVDIPDDKFFVSTNGIQPVAINKKWQRDLHRLMWTSSYDRGLAYLLKIWPDIIKEVPDANLHIYYGWNLFDRFHSNNPERMAWKAKVVEMINQPGIIHHGRVGHQEIRKSLAESGIFSYPTDFQEISCCVGETPILMPRNHKKYPYGIPIKELVGKSGFYVYSYDHEIDKIVLGKVKWVKMTRKNAKLLRITLDDGTILRFTPDHKFLLRNGEYKEAKDLIIGESLMPCYERPTFAIKQTDGSWPEEHRMLAESLWGNLKGKIVDHKDGNRYDNTLDNLQLLTPSEHTRKIANKDRVITNVGKKRMSEAQIKLAKTPERIKFLSNLGTLRANKFWSIFKTWSPEKQKEWTTNRQLKKNHSVIDICDDLVKEDVYDMEVEKYHTFSSGGVFVHNCISAEEAQAYGTIPCVTDYAALKETVQYGIKVPFDITTNEGQEEYKKELIALMKDTKKQEEIRKEMMPWAQDFFLWKYVAKYWSEQFKNLFKKGIKIPKEVKK